MKDKFGFIGEEMKLKDCCTLLSDGNWIESKDQSPDGIRLIQTGNIGNGKYLDKIERAKYISNTTFNNLHCIEVFPGDILISRLPDPVGRACIVPDNGERMITAVDCSILRVNEQVINKRYLLHFLKSNNYFNQLSTKLAGTTRTRISRKNLEMVEVNIPSKEVQEKVVNILDSIDNLIGLKQAQLLELDNLIKARFVEMFGDPLLNNLGWKQEKLENIVSPDCSISYGIVQTGDEQIDGIPVFRPVDIVNRIPKHEDLKKTTPEISNKYKRTILKGRELLITVRANIGDTCIVGEEFKGCNVGRGIVPIRTKEDIISLEFLKHQLDNWHMNSHIKSMAKGITLVQLNMEDLRDLKVILPPIEKQNMFVSFAKQMYEVVEETRIVREPAENDI